MGSTSDIRAMENRAKASELAFLALHESTEKAEKILFHVDDKAKPYIDGLKVTVETKYGPRSVPHGVIEYKDDDDVKKLQEKINKLVEKDVFLESDLRETQHQKNELYSQFEECAKRTAELQRQLEEAGKPPSTSSAGGTTRTIFDEPLQLPTYTTTPPSAPSAITSPSAVTVTTPSPPVTPAAPDVSATTTTPTITTTTATTPTPSETTKNTGGGFGSLAKGMMFSLVTSLAQPFTALTTTQASTTTPTTAPATKVAPKSLRDIPLIEVPSRTTRLGQNIAAIDAICTQIEAIHNYCIEYASGDKGLTMALLYAAWFNKIPAFGGGVTDAPMNEFTNLANATIMDPRRKKLADHGAGKVYIKGLELRLPKGNFKEKPIGSVLEENVLGDPVVKDSDEYKWIVGSMVAYIVGCITYKAWSVPIERKSLTDWSVIGTTPDVNQYGAFGFAIDTKLSEGEMNVSRAVVAIGYDVTGDMNERWKINVQHKGTNVGWNANGTIAQFLINLLESHKATEYDIYNRLANYLRNDEIVNIRNWSPFGPVYGFNPPAEYEAAAYTYSYTNFLKAYMDAIRDPKGQLVKA